MADEREVEEVRGRQNAPCVRRPPKSNFDPWWCVTHDSPMSRFTLLCRVTEEADDDD